MYILICYRIIYMYSNVTIYQWRMWFSLLYAYPHLLVFVSHMLIVLPNIIYGGFHQPQPNCLLESKHETTNFNSFAPQPFLCSFLNYYLITILHFSLSSNISTFLVKHEERAKIMVLIINSYN